MNEIEFSALMVSRVCHDLVGPLGAVVNGLEVLEDERDAAMREDAIRLVSTSANQALARIQFMRIAFGAAGFGGRRTRSGRNRPAGPGPARRRQGQAGMECAASLLGQGLGEVADECDPVGRRLPAARRRGHGRGRSRRRLAFASMPPARWRASPKRWSACSKAASLPTPLDARGIQPYPHPPPVRGRFNAALRSRPAKVWSR